MMNSLMQNAVPEPELDIHRALRRAAVKEKLLKPATGPAPRKRVEIILECALRLFNQFGVTGVSTNRIAAALGISPGNVHYHYRTKSDLLLAAFSTMDFELRGVCARLNAIEGFAGYVDWQVNAQSVLWRHRYFFGSLEIVLRAVPGLPVAWLELQSALIGQLAATHEHYAGKREMARPKTPNTIAQVAQNCMMLWMSWIRWEFLALNGQMPETQEEKEIIRRLVWHHLSFYEPYHVRSPRAAAALAGALDERLLSGKTV